MIARGTGGSIVNISSLASQLAVKDHVAYCATKGAVDLVTKTMALEMGPHKVRRFIEPSFVYQAIIDSNCDTMFTS
jgi:NAD(P)-dependent dehydrogenase (short-subunit alcohol dehydrogenase family)